MNRKIGPKTLPSRLQVAVISPEEEQELDYNVCCCVEEIENILSKSPTEKQKKLAEVSLRILKNPGESFIKKKQVMRQWFGDYKNKFEAQKLKIVANLNDSKVAFKPSEVPHKSVFIKKHVVKANGDNSSDIFENVAISKKQTCEPVGSKVFKFDF